MNKLKGSMDVKLPLEDVNQINELIERDTAKAVIADDHYNLTYCPICRHVPLSTDVFCSKCGQRLDTENKAL